VQPAAGSTSPGSDGERHHAVIVFADVVAYSRLMADDEPGTLNRGTALYKDVLKPEAERRRGQVREMRGDGTLLGFEPIADTVEWSRLAHRAAAATGIGDTATRPNLRYLIAALAIRAAFPRPERSPTI
jgi:class 3 adenylate cyclase